MANTSNVPASPGAYQLIKNNSVIYVGSADDLNRRYGEWSNSPDNPCVKRSGFDLFRWQVTQTLAAARQLELDWYNTFRPVCNLVSPPG